MSSSSSRFCFNTECRQLQRDQYHYRPAWRLRSGDFADLCDRCASAYEQGKFCEIFHIRASGWRFCECCGKKIHCGCVASASAFVLLDAGGIQCLACARKKFALVPNFAPPQFFFPNPPIAEKFRDLSINYSSSNEPNLLSKSFIQKTLSNQISCPPPSFQAPSVRHFDLHKRGDVYEFSEPSSNDKSTACSAERNRGVNDLMGKLMSETSENYKSDIHRQKPGPSGEVPPCPNANVYHPLISLMEGPCGTQLAFPVPITTPTETNGNSRLDGSNLQHAPKYCPLSLLPNDLNGGADWVFESKISSLGTHHDTQGKYQVVPRYWPKSLYKNPELQNLSKESKVVVPLFEKVLSSSDTGRSGRFVVPKNSAEAFFPRISHPGGVPLKLQDSMGEEWTFQLRFWPNNRSRIYFLEGVSECIQSMQLQAGDTVIFSRLDPERKLIMDFRKALVAQSSDQEPDFATDIHDNCTYGDTRPVHMPSPSEVKQSAYTAKKLSGVSKKKKSSMMTTRSKRQKVEKGDLTELKLTWEEAQGFILPPPNSTPSIVVIDEFEFEEYEDDPIIGKPVYATDGRRSTCSTDQEQLIAKEHDEETMEGIEQHLMSPKATTKHPRHKSDCTCIVCLQHPSGSGPKHDQYCSCTVCSIIQRRRHSQLLWREKKRIEKSKKAQKELKSLNTDEELHHSANNIGNTSNNHEQNSLLKSRLDLNFLPEKDEESLPGSNTTPKTMSLNQDYTVSPALCHQAHQVLYPYSQFDKRKENSRETQ